MAQHEQGRMQWDKLATANTRPAMKGGVPFWAIFPIFFGPGILLVLTFQVFYMALIPISWVVIKLVYLGNHNRPWEWFLWITSGSLLADWKEWGGITNDPIGASNWDGLQ